MWWHSLLPCAHSACRWGRQVSLPIYVGRWHQSHRLRPADVRLSTGCCQPVTLWVSVANRSSLQLVSSKLYCATNILSYNFASYSLLLCGRWFTPLVHCPKMYSMWCGKIPVAVHVLTRAWTWMWHGATCNNFRVVLSRQSSALVLRAEEWDTGGRCTWFNSYSIVTNAVTYNAK